MEAALQLALMAPSSSLRKAAGRVLLHGRKTCGLNDSAVMSVVIGVEVNEGGQEVGKRAGVGLGRVAKLVEYGKVDKVGTKEVSCSFYLADFCLWRVWDCRIFKFGCAFRFETWYLV